MMTASTRTRLASAIVILLFAVGDDSGALHAAAQATGRADIVVDFERLPNGSSTIPGPIGDDYAEWGIRFRSIDVDVSQSPQYERVSGGRTYADAAACSYPTGFNVVADFDVPVYAVSAYVTSAAGRTVRMVAKDAGGAVLASAVSPTILTAGTFVGPVALTSNAPIASVEWWPSATTSGLSLDDLRIVVDEMDPRGTGRADGPGYLVAYWNLNEAQGSTAHDTSGYHNNGVLHGPVVWAAGHDGTGLGFTGQNNYVLVENSPELNATGAITLAGWIKPAWTGNNRILQKGANDNQYRLLREHEKFVFDLAGVASGRLEHEAVPPSGEWTHVAATYDGLAMKLYYGTTCVKTQPASGFISSSMDPLCIGSKRTGAPLGDEYRGLMDELRIYNRALTSGEIKALVEPIPDCNLRVTDVKLVRGELTGGRFQAIEEVDKVAVGDLFQIVVEVTNMGAVRKAVSNLYGWTLSGQGNAQVIGQPCVGLYLIPLDPGESALLNAFCPGSQAFEAKTAGSVNMDIGVSPDCNDTFRFEITPPACQPEVTDVRIMRGQFNGGRFQRTGEVDKVAVGDQFQIVVDVTNNGTTTVNVFNLFQATFSGQGKTKIVGNPCVGVYPISLDPGESATLDAFCPGTQAYEAAQAGWVTMDIAVGKCHDAFPFEITPPPCQPEVTDVQIWRGQLAGGRFQRQEQVDKVAVGDLFQIVVEVTNTGTTTKTVANLYGWTFSGQGQAQVVGQLCVGLYLIDLDPGESALLNAFCPGSQAFQATQAGWVTMDIAVEDCHDTFRFEVLPAESCQPQVTDVEIVRLTGPPFQEAGEVDEVTVGDLFTVKVHVTNQGNSPVGVSNVYQWTLSGQGDAEVVDGPPCVCLAWGMLQPGESATLIPFCGCHAFQATASGQVTMDITVGDEDCHHSLTFDILPAESCQPEITSVQIFKCQLVGSRYQKIGQVSEVTVGDCFTIDLVVTNQGDSPVDIGFGRYGWAFSGQGSVTTVGDLKCIGLPAPQTLQPGQSATLIPFLNCQAFQATAAGWVTMDATVSPGCQHPVPFQIVSGP